MIKGLDHIAIAVNDLAAAVDAWQRVAGATVIHRGIVESQGVELVMVEIGPLKVELIHPVNGDSSVAKFLAKRGEGVHHISLECDSAQDELDRVRAQGVELIDDVARVGAADSRIGFIHPRSLDGVLLEFVEHPPRDK